MTPSDNLSAVIIEGFNGKFSSEREFRERIVIKLLESLGWTDVNDLVFEYPIKVGTQTVRVDYLVGTGSNRFILEVKSPKISISKGDMSCSQIMSYLKLVDDVNYGALYNGRILLIFTKGSNDPIMVWNGKNDISAFHYLSKPTFPWGLNFITGKSEIPFSENKGIISGGIAQSKDSKSRIRYTQLRIIGYITIISFILSLVLLSISASGGGIERNIGIFFALLFTFSLFAFTIDLIRLKLLDLVKRKQSKP